MGLDMAAKAAAGVDSNMSARFIPEQEMTLFVASLAYFSLQCS
jgi:hypothetical protein